MEFGKYGVIVIGIVISEDGVVKIFVFFIEVGVNGCGIVLNVCDLF